MKKILITVGLPASGKTTFAKEYVKKYHKYSQYDYGNTNYKVAHIDIDLLKDFRYNEDKDVISIIKEKTEYGADEFIVDGLFLSTEDVIQVLEAMIPQNQCKVEIHYWLPDIQKCLHNDIGRRLKKSSITIKNANISKIDIEEIKFKIGLEDIVLIEHEVVEKPFWKTQSDLLGIYISDEKYLESDSWSVGGTWCNCWGESGEISVDNQPTTFAAFDEILEKICPQISFLQYNNLYSACVSVDYFDDGDYYGGNVTYAYFKCDLELLFNTLQEKGLLNC